MKLYLSYFILMVFRVGYHNINTQVRVAPEAVGEGGQGVVKEEVRG